MVEKNHPSFDEYCLIANMLKDIKCILQKYPLVKPKISEYRKQQERVTKNYYKIINDLEELMFTDCYQEVHTLTINNDPIPRFNLATHIFYNTKERVDSKKKIIYVCK